MDAESELCLEFEELLAAREKKQKTGITNKNQSERVGDADVVDFEPLPPGSFEVLKSNQIWETVVKYVADPLDWSSMKRTCTTFHDLLGEKATLTEVLKIISREGYLQSMRIPISSEHNIAVRTGVIHNLNQDGVPVPEDQQENILPPLPLPDHRNLDMLVQNGLPPDQDNAIPPLGPLPFLNLIRHGPELFDADFLARRHRRIMGNMALGPRQYWTWTPLNLRLVSKTWKVATEEAFMNEFSGQWQYDLTRFAKGMRFRYRNELDLERAIEILKNSDRPAPLVKILEIHKFCDESNDGFSTKFLEFLDDYGSSVRGLIVNWSSANRRSPVDRYQRLLSLMMRMPNLKMLMMENDSSISAPSSRENLIDLQSIIDQRPLPRLPYLEVFSAKEGYMEENVILKEIFCKTPNIKSILIPTLIKDGNVGPLIEVMGKLRIVYFEQNDSLFPDDLLNSVSWPLRELHAKNSCVTSSDFDIIHRFAMTLECLELGNLQLKLGPNPLKLPNLRKLHLGGLVQECFTGLDFLIPLESLEDLSFVCPNSFHTKSIFKQYLIDVYEYVDKMEESNIWRCFPSLRRLRIEGGNSEPSSFDTDAAEYMKQNGFVKKRK